VRENDSVLVQSDDRPREESGQFCGFPKMTRDITDRKETHEKLRESKQQLQTLIEGAKTTPY
jgi:PAS domain-containing protein